MTIRAVLSDHGNTLLEYGYQGRWREFLRQEMEDMSPLVLEFRGAAGVPPADLSTVTAGNSVQVEKWR
jgi:hypothetical protein